MIITDAHRHFWKKEVIIGLFEQLQAPLDGVAAIIHDFEPKDLKPWLDKLGVSQTVVVQVNSTLENTHAKPNIAARQFDDWVEAMKVAASTPL